MPPLYSRSRVNYDLARIIPPPNNVLTPNSRPIIVIDPRAGNGPGIGGSKRDSEIGDGLLGGIWMASFLADLGNGNFDGAWLEENFESLNPGNTLWTKQYDLYSNFVKKNRSPVSPDNPFLAIEKKVSDNIVSFLDGYQSVRDHFDETLFFAIYESPWMKMLYPEASQKRNHAQN